MTSRLRLRATFLLAAGLLSGAALMVTASPAAAHSFDGSGDCDSWTVELDGLFGAHTIIIDGVNYAPALKYTISDDSDAESRTFTIQWDKKRADVTRTSTLSRNTDGCTPPTTETPTTVPPTTVPEPVLVPPTVIVRPPATPVPAAPQFTG